MPNHRVPRTVSYLKGSWIHDRDHLEKIVGDDWRVFRAKLCAKERQANEKNSNVSESIVQQAVPDKSEDTTVNHLNPAEAFASNILSSIFKKKKQSEQEQEGAPLLHANVVANEQRRKLNELKNVDAYGADEKISTHDSDLRTSNELQVSITDEAMLSIQETAQTDFAFNENRWAHPLSHVEKGCLLLASEKLGGIFHQTVVLIISHNDNLGSMGVVINRPLGKKIKELSGPARKSTIPDAMRSSFAESTVTYGGPVQTDHYAILHGYNLAEGAVELTKGVFVGGHTDLERDVRSGCFLPMRALLVKGHAAWVPGQLQREISKGVWHIAAASSDLILRYAGAKEDPETEFPDNLWSEILSAMDGDYKKIALANCGKEDSRKMP
eukprot:CAMPEP_0113310102 /NCGR_PEP_ID=MMETSP0010_2-20120614/7879_1 /TAXON_ID=216773 ORGANISM="Corethron hystrix, Strain 308" /NCGR_SAMPLE_ID=MMETSP0010_2 /ASSEMBLY_ACC=CAM_ASM_000155 /LENGTH=382 /DNA_ID=CAMNT_0000165485 /DNA_START=315 /DNA_END=1463 /DNA_ORIENTATION=- /assembly_acc=CAM_ASM_000155